VAIRVAGTDWQEALETRSSPGGRERTISTDANLTYDTIIEVVDPTRGEVIATGTHPLALWGFTNKGDLIFHRFLDDNTPVCEIWKADFVNVGVKEMSEKR
jgi:hypothetical protein